MSSFNTILIPCPKCGNNTPVQTKAGSCNMETKYVFMASLSELENIAADPIFCANCKIKLGIGVQYIVQILHFHEDAPVENKPMLRIVKPEDLN